jgi:hypothetical protein
MRWLLGREPRFEGYTVEWVEPGNFILSRRDMLFQTIGPGSEIRPLARFRTPLPQRILSRSRLAQRLLRFSFYNVVRLEGSTYFLSFGKSIGLLRNGQVIDITGMRRPARILRNACAVDARGDLYFGEYVPYEPRGEVHVYRLPAGSTRVEIAHTFAPGEIGHVHGVYFDPYDDSLWCVTGDAPSECRMLRTQDGFRTVGVMGAGDESWRCVSLLFTPSAVYYGTDSEFIRNLLYRIPRTGGPREVLAQLEGPVYYSTSCGEDLFFGVTAELCPSQVEPSGVIWNVAPDGTCRRVAALSKDRLPVRYFMPGTINFAGGPGLADDVYFQGVALVGADTQAMRLTRDAAFEPGPRSNGRE